MDNLIPTDNHSVPFVNSQIDWRENLTASKKTWQIKHELLKADADLASDGLGCDSCACCFMPGTLVLLADGSRRAIESFRGGEQVLTLSGMATVQSLERVQLGYTRRIIELDSGNDKPLLMSDDHTLWTRASDGRQWWGTYNFSHYLFERHSGLGPKLDTQPLALRFDLVNEHAHITGWRKLRPIFHALPTQTEIYHLKVDQGGSYIADGYVVGSYCRDEDVAGANWAGINGLLQNAS